MAESKTPSTSSIIEDAIAKNKAAIDQIDKLCEKLKKKAIEANSRGNKVEAKKYLQAHKRQINIKENIKIQINDLEQCRPNAGGAAACPMPTSEEIRKVNIISEIIDGPVSDDADDAAMLQRFREEFPEAQPDASGLAEELERFLSEDGYTAATNSEGEAKKEDGFNVNTWPRPEGSLCSSPDEIWELNDDGKLKISLTSFESDIKSNDLGPGVRVGDEPVKNLWKEIMESADPSARQGISSEVKTSVEKNHAAVRLLGFKDDLKALFNAGPDKWYEKEREIKSAIYLLDNKTLINYKKMMLCSEDEIIKTRAPTIKFIKDLYKKQESEKAEQRREANNEAKRKERVEANKKKKYRMSNKNQVEKNRMLTIDPSANTDRRELIEILTKYRPTLSPQKIKEFYKEVEDIYKKYHKGDTKKLIDTSFLGSRSSDHTPTANHLHKKFIESYGGGGGESKSYAPPPEEVNIKLSLTQILNDIPRLLNSFIPNIKKSLQDIASKKWITPMMITYIVFIYKKLNKERYFNSMPFQPNSPGQVTPHTHDYTALKWAQDDKYKFEVVIDGLFLLFKNETIKKPDIFDVIVTIHILYNCEYGLEMKGVFNNPLPSLLMYKRVRYYCDREHPEIFDILDMSEMIEAKPHFNPPSKIFGKTSSASDEVFEKASTEFPDWAPTSWSQQKMSPNRKDHPPSPPPMNDKSFFYQNAMPLLKDHLGYFKLFFDPIWRVFLGETFSMAHNYITLIDKDEENKNKHKIFKPGLKWFEHVLERGTNAYYWLYTSLLIAIKEEVIDGCSDDIVCSDKQPEEGEYYGSNEMTNILKILNCNVYFHVETFLDIDDHLNITKFIPRAIEIYEEMERSGKMVAIEREADSKLEKGKIYDITENGKRYYLKVPNFDDDVIIQRSNIKKKLVELLLKSADQKPDLVELYKTVFNAGLNDIPVPIGKKPRRETRKTGMIKKTSKEIESGRVTFCSFDESDLIEKYYVEYAGKTPKESEYTEIKNKTRKCKRKRPKNKTRKSFRDRFRKSPEKKKREQGQKLKKQREKIEKKVKKIDAKNEKLKE